MKGVGVSEGTGQVVVAGGKEVAVTAEGTVVAIDDVKGVALAGLAMPCGIVV